MAGKYIGSLFVIFASMAIVNYDAVGQSVSGNKAHKTSLFPTKQLAADQVKQETGGRILDVKKQSLKSGTNVWHVKFLKDGRIQFKDIVLKNSSD